jgi:hypothetical protein
MRIHLTNVETGLKMLLCGLLGASIGASLKAASAQELQRVRPAAANSIERVLDSTVGAVCYVYHPSGSMSCVKLVR